MAVTITGGTLSTGGAVVETSTGIKVCMFVNSGGYLVAYKNIDGTPLIYGPSQTPANIHGGGAIGFVHAAIDSNDILHLVSAVDGAGMARDIAYNTLDLIGASWGTWEEAMPYAQTTQPTNPGCAISIDSNDKPHVLAVDYVKAGGTSRDNVYYVNKTTGSWSSKEQVGVRAVKTDGYDSPTLTLCPSDDVEAFYYFTTSGDPAHRRRNGEWGTESTYTETDAVIGFPGVVITSGDTPYRYHADTNDNIEENNSDTTYNAGAFLERVSACLDGTDRYIFYVDGSDDVHVISNSGSGWTDEGAQQAGTYLAVICGWQYNNHNWTDEIGYIFCNNTNVYYDSFSLVSGVTVTPGVASAIASAQNPSVVLGSMSMTPGVASSKANAQNPTVVLGSISLTPAIASALANCQDPGVIMGSINITPAVAQAIASALDPAVIMSSMIMTPAVASAIATAQDPGVVLGSISITPAVASSIAQAIDPTVQVGDIFVTPGAAGAIAAAQDPAVILGSMSVTPAVAQAIAETLDPDVILGDITLSPDPASAIAEALDPGVILGSITLTPAVAQALVSAIDPAVVLDSMVVTPGVASAIAQALDPTVYEGDVTLTPGAASAIAKALDPTVVITGGPEVGRWPIINLIWTFGVMGKREE